MATPWRFKSSRPHQARIPCSRQGVRAFSCCPADRDGAGIRRTFRNRKDLDRAANRTAPAKRRADRRDRGHGAAHCRDDGSAGAERLDSGGPCRRGGSGIRGGGRRDQETGEPDPRNGDGSVRHEIHRPVSAREAPSAHPADPAAAARAGFPGRGFPRPGCLPGSLSGWRRETARPARACRLFS